MGGHSEVQHDLYLYLDKFSKYRELIQNSPLCFIHITKKCFYHNCFFYCFSCTAYICACWSVEQCFVYSVDCVICIITWPTVFLKIQAHWSREQNQLSTQLMCGQRQLPQCYRTALIAQSGVCRSGGICSVCPRYKQFCTGNVLTQRTIKAFPNQKPWMTSTVRVLLRERDTAFRTGDKQAYNEARGKLQKDIKDAKCSYKRCTEELFNNNPVACGKALKHWQITKPTICCPVRTLLCLNCFFTYFETQR